MSYLPKVRPPNAGIHPRSANGIKRARVDWAGTTSTLSTAVFPTNQNVPGVGDHATANRPVNATIPVTYRCVPFSSVPWVQQIPDDALLFSYRQNNEVLLTKNDVNRVIMLTMPCLHYQLHVCTQNEPDKWEPADVLAYWSLEGIMGTQGPPPGMEGTERTVLAMPRGDYQTYNIWGPAFGGQHLWLVLKKVPVNNGTVYVTEVGGGGIQVPGTRRKDGKGDIAYVTRFVPVISDSAHYVKWEDRVYTEDCVQKVGPCMYVGRVVRNVHYDPSKVSSLAVSDTATTSMPRLKQCAKIEIIGDMVGHGGANVH